MHDEVTSPLGLNRLEWVWTPELESMAPMNVRRDAGGNRLQAVGLPIHWQRDLYGARFCPFRLRNGAGTARRTSRPWRSKARNRGNDFQTLPDGIGFGYSVTNMQRDPRLICVMTN